MIEKEQNSAGGTPAPQTTRQQLLEAAGQVFAEKGFDRATGKEICERAHANTAAVNYYFQGMDGLYAAVLCEAHSRIINIDALSAAVQQSRGAGILPAAAYSAHPPTGGQDARPPSAAIAKLHAFLSLFVKAITNPSNLSWEMRVISREIAAPSPALDELREKQILPKLRIVRSIVSELMALPEDHPAVARGCVSVIAPCFMLLIADRRTIKSLFPSLTLVPADAEVLVGHLVRYAVAGLTAISSDSRSEC